MAQVFVGIPTLNRPQMVLETIESVRHQTFRDFRVIVSDNQSASDAAGRVKSYMDGLGDPRFSFCQQETNVGEYGQGRFFFRAAAEEEFFMILHDDDVLTPEYLDHAVRILRCNPDVTLFAANPYLMDATGRQSPEQTDRFMRDHGRIGVAEGVFDVRSRHLQSGFTPISGTLFRRQALIDSGFVDSDCEGNYPFECNVFLRLADIAARGWFSPRELLGVRYHPGSLRTQSWTKDPRLVRTSIRLYARRRYAGADERRRRLVLARFYRLDALIRLREGDLPGCRASLRLALRQNAFSPKTWGLLPLVLFCPWLLRVFTPPSPLHAHVSADSAQLGSD